MPLFRSRREVDEVNARIARERVASLRSRAPSATPSRPGGWVPQVPRSSFALEAPSTSVNDAEPGPLTDPDEFIGRDPEHDQYGERLAAAVARFGIGRTHVVAVALALVVGLVITGVMAWAARPEVAPVEADVIATGTPLPQPAVAEHEPGAPDGGGSASGPDEAGEVVVHVDGKVEEPGVITLPAGSRVVDAIDAAGGAEPGVDLVPLNLARVVVDGEQVLVGIDPPPGSDASESRPADGSDTSNTGRPIDLNAATADDLEALPGIGPTLAQRILQWRAAHGRFTTVDELREVSGIGEQRFADLAPQVTV